MDTVKIKIVKAFTAEDYYENGDILEAVRGHSAGWYIIKPGCREFSYYVSKREAVEIVEEDASEAIYVKVIAPVLNFESCFEVGRAYPAKRCYKGFNLQRPGSSGFHCLAWDYEVEALQTKPAGSLSTSKEYIIVQDNSSEFSVGDIVKPYRIHGNGVARANTATTNYTAVNNISFEWVLEIIQDPIQDQESTIDYSDSEMELTGIDATLEERGERYGPYEHTSRIAQNIKGAFKDTPNWGDLSDIQKESLDMCANKFARILNGDAEYLDSWHDVIGYVQLVMNSIEESDEV